MSNVETLMELKEKIEEGKTKRNKLEGQREEAMRTLKKEFKVKGVKSGKALLKKMKEEIEEDGKVLAEQIVVLEERIN